MLKAKTFADVDWMRLVAEIVVGGAFLAMGIYLQAEAEGDDLMDPFTAWIAIVGAMGLAGGAFVLWVVPRIDERDRRHAARAHPAE